MLCFNHNIMKCESTWVIGRAYINCRNRWRVKFPVNWEKPEREMTKLNFDGSCSGKNGECSIGGLLRNYRGEFLFGYGEPIGRSNIKSAQVRALLRGMELAVEKGWKSIWVEGDDKYLVDAIVDGRYVGSEEEVELIRRINMIRRTLSCCLFTHVFREGNRAADAMAKMAHGLTKLQVWDKYPPSSSVRRRVEEDAMGKTVLRKVNSHACMITKTDKNKV